MKKMRGKRRHYRNIIKRIDRFIDRFKLHFEDQLSWFDKYHEHLDWDGFSSRVRHRRNHIRYYIKALRSMKNIDGISSKPFQSFVFLDHIDSTDDAIFLHTPNPNNGSMYPFINSDIAWLDFVPRLLEGLINLDEFEIGQYREGDGKVGYFLRLIELGDSLK